MTDLQCPLGYKQTLIRGRWGVDGGQSRLHSYLDAIYWSTLEAKLPMAIPDQGPLLGPRLSNFYMAADLDTLD